MELSDLKTSITDMTDAELEASMKDVRAQRRNSTRKKKASTKKATPKEVSFDNMSTEALEGLLEAFGGTDGTE